MEDAWGAVHNIAVSQTSSDRVDLLELLREVRQGESTTTLIKNYGASSETVYRQLGDFEQLGFVVNIAGEGFRITRAGSKAIEAYEQVSQRMGNRIIAYFAKSPYRRQVVRVLASEPADKAQLAAREELPSRATIHRTLDQFEAHSWLIRTEGGQFRVKESAVVALEQFEWLLEAFEQAIANAPALNVMEFWTNPSLHSLRGGELVVEKGDRPHAMLDAAVEAAKLRENGLTHVRSITPVFDPVIFDVFSQYIDDDIHQQVVFDQRTYQQLAKPSHLHYLAGAILAPSIDVRIHPDPLYTGLAIYNHETVMVGGSTRFDRHAAVVGNGDSLKSWANRTFEQIWSESQRPSERFRGWLSRTVPVTLE